MKAHTISSILVLITVPSVAVAQDLPVFDDDADAPPPVESVEPVTNDAPVTDAVAESATADPAADDPEPDEPAPKPSVYHTPKMSQVGGNDAHIRATVFADWEYERVYLAYRPAEANSEFTEVDFERTGDTSFVAIIPGSEMQPPGVEYYIASRSREGERDVHYASSDAPHQLVVLGETAQTREAARLARHDGNRSEFELEGDFTNWGRRSGTRGAEDYITDPLSDWMWSSTLHYRYRFLSSLYEIAFGLGVIRGNNATFTTEEGDTAVAGSGVDTNPEDPGMNYGYGQVTWEFHRNFSVDGRLLLGASSTGFAAGVGGVARIGRLGGTRLELGGELFQDIGNRGFMGFHWDTLPRVPMGLTIELTNRPSPNLAAGTRLLYDVGFEFSDAFGMTATVGVPVRNGAVAQGLSGGLSARYAF